MQVHYLRGQLAVGEYNRSTIYTFNDTLAIHVWHHRLNGKLIRSYRLSYRPNREHDSILNIQLNPEDVKRALQSARRIGTHVEIFRIVFTTEIVGQ